VAPFKIRVFGDPVLRQPTHDVTAPQVGIQKRFFVYDIGTGPHAVVNPRLSGHDGEWTYEEGCLSVPELSWPIVRYERVHLDGFDLSGAELSIDADELLARMFQHECDHLDGMLLLERLDKRQRKGAMRTLRQRALGLSEEADVSVDAGSAGHAPAPDETASVTR